LPSLIGNSSALTFDERSRALLDKDEYLMLKKYIDSGGKQLASDTIASFFNLYLNGSDIKEIHRLNKAFPIESIYWAFVKFDWPKQKDAYIAEMQNTVKDRLVKANLETVGFLTDLLAAANRRHGDKIKKYLQTGNEKDLGDSLGIESIHGLLKVVEGLQKITGQDRTQILKREDTLNLNVNTGKGGSPQDVTPLEPEDAAKILQIVSESKKRKDIK
jgi:hypothetical protein